MTEQNVHRARGVFLVLLGGLCLSTGGVLIRTVEHIDPWTILFYRAAGFVVLLLAVIAYRHRGRTFEAFRATGIGGAVLAVTLAGGFTCYVFGMLMTTVANVSFIISSGPLFAALLGWFLLRERVRPVTWLVIFGAAAGMGLMFAEGFQFGGNAGNLVALGMPITFAVMLVMIRRAGDTDMLPATCMAGVIAGAVSFFLAGDLTVSTRDFWLLAWLGVGQLGAGFMFITMGTRHIRAAEAAVLALVESVAAPIWAWLFINQVPGGLALIGGLIVFACVSVEGLTSLMRERRNRKTKVAEETTG